MTTTERTPALGGDGAQRSDPKPEGEAVAWRWRNKPDGVWNYQEARQRIPNVEQQPLYAHPAPEPVDRETIARIIHPDGWRTYDEEVRDCKFWGTDLNPLAPPDQFVTTASSLRKADTILSVLSKGGRDV